MIAKDEARVCWSWTPDQKVKQVLVYKPLQNRQASDEYEKRNLKNSSSFFLAWRGPPSNDEGMTHPDAYLNLFLELCYYGLVDSRQALKEFAKIKECEWARQQLC